MLGVCNKRWSFGQGRQQYTFSFWCKQYCDTLLEGMFYSGAVGAIFEQLGGAEEGIFSCPPNTHNITEISPLK